MISDFPCVDGPFGAQSLWLFRLGLDEGTLDHGDRMPSNAVQLG